MEVSNTANKGNSQMINAIGKDILYSARFDGFQLATGNGYMDATESVVRAQQAPQLIDDEDQHDEEQHDRNRR